MQAKQQGLLESYNSLTDENLARHFANRNKQKHLKQMGLITADGRILDGESVRLFHVRKEHKEKSRRAISEALVTRAVEMERKRRGELKKKIELLTKFESAERIKYQARNPGGVATLDVLPSLSSTLETHGNQLQLSQDERTQIGDLIGPQKSIPTNYINPYSRGVRTDCYPMMSAKSHMFLRPPAAEPRPHSSMNVRVRQSRLRRAHTAPVKSKTNQITASSREREDRVHTNIAMTIRYVGVGVDLNSAHGNTNMIHVEQQHCGGNTICLFQGYLQPNDEFTIISRRHYGMPLGLSFYVNRLVDSRLSACCEYKYNQRLIVGKSGHFRVVGVAGGRRCYLCQANRSPRKNINHAHKREEETPVANDKEGVALVVGVVSQNDVVTGNEDDYGSDFEDDNPPPTNPSPLSPHISSSSPPTPSSPPPPSPPPSPHSSPPPSPLSPPHLSPPVPKNDPNYNSNIETQSIKSDTSESSSSESDSDHKSSSSSSSSHPSVSSQRSTKEPDRHGNDDSAHHRNDTSAERSGTEISISRTSVSNNGTQNGEEEGKREDTDGTTPNQPIVDNTSVGTPPGSPLEGAGNILGSRGSTEQTPGGSTHSVDTPTSDYELKKYLEGIINRASQFVKNERRPTSDSPIIPAPPTSTPAPPTTPDPPTLNLPPPVVTLATPTPDTQDMDEENRQQNGGSPQSPSPILKQSDSHSSLERILAAAMEGESDEPNSETENGRQGRIGMRPDIGNDSDNENRALIIDSHPDIELKTEDEVSDRETENAKKKQYETKLSNDTRYSSGDAPTSEVPAADNNQGSPHYDEVFYRTNENLYTPVIPSAGDELRPRTFSFKSTGDSRSRLSESGRFADPSVPDTPGYVSQAEYQYIPLTELKGPTHPLVQNPVQSSHEYPRDPAHLLPVGQDKETDNASLLNNKEHTSSDSINVDNLSELKVERGEEEKVSSAKGLNRQVHVETTSLSSDRIQLEMNTGDQNENEDRQNRNEDIKNENPKHGNEDSQNGNVDVENGNEDPKHGNEDTENTNEDTEHGNEDPKHGNEDSEHVNDKDVENRNEDIENGDIEHENEDSKHDEIKDPKHGNEDSEHGNEDLKHKNEHDIDHKNNNEDKTQSPKSPVHSSHSLSVSSSSGANHVTPPAAALKDNSD